MPCEQGLYVNVMLCEPFPFGWPRDIYQLR